MIGVPPSPLSHYFWMQFAVTPVWKSIMIKQYNYKKLDEQQLEGIYLTEWNLIAKVIKVQQMINRGMYIMVMHWK